MLDGGTIAPGFSAGTLALDGDFTMTIRSERPIFLKISEARCGLVVLPYLASRRRYPGKLGLAKMRC